MRELVRQQVARGGAGFPFREIARTRAVLRAAMMLQADAAELIGNRQQEFVMIVVLRASSTRR
jgi:hypothetical protein